MLRENNSLLASFFLSFWDLSIKYVFLYWIHHASTNNLLTHDCNRKTQCQHRSIKFETTSFHCLRILHRNVKKISVAHGSTGTDCLSHQTVDRHVFHQLPYPSAILINSPTEWHLWSATSSGISLSNINNSSKPAFIVTVLFCNKQTRDVQ